MKECTGEVKEKEGEFDEMANSSGAAQKDFIFIRLPVLREVSGMCVLERVGEKDIVFLHACRVFVCVCVNEYMLIVCSIWSESFVSMVCLFLLTWR